MNKPVNEQYACKCKRDTLKLPNTCANIGPISLDCYNKTSVYGELVSNNIDGLYCPDDTYLRAMRFKKGHKKDYISGIQVWCGEEQSCSTKEWRSRYTGDANHWHKVDLSIPGTQPLRIITRKDDGDLLYSPTNLMDIGLLDLQKCSEADYNIYEVDTSKQQLKGVVWSADNERLIGIQFLYDMKDPKCMVDSRLKVQIV